jgi:thiol-disulfide isomerase/thioredoxin
MSVVNQLADVSSDPGPVPEAAVDAVVDPALVADLAAGGPEGACLLFTAPWCPTGSVLAKSIAGAEDSDDEGTVDVAVIDVDVHPYLADKYLVISLPTLLVVKDGRERGRLLGAFSPAEARTLLRRTLAPESVHLDPVPRRKARR